MTNFRLSVVVIVLPVVCWAFQALTERRSTRWTSRNQAVNALPPPLLDIPHRGLATLEEESNLSYLNSNPPDASGLKYSLPARWNQFLTKFRLWLQVPWRKIGEKVVLKVNLGGSLSIEPSTMARFMFGSQHNAEAVDSLHDLSTLLMFAAYDPRVLGIHVELGTMHCGYGKLREVRRMLDLYRQSGKKIIGYSESASEKELYIAVGFDEFYMPPTGALQLRGFQTSASFFRGVLDNIGIEPQVQRIGKYKSFGDTFNRSNISDAQREVASSILLQASDHWAQDIAQQTNNTLDDIRSIWAAEGVHMPGDYALKKLITGVKYHDQVEDIVNYRFDQKRGFDLFAWANRKYLALKNTILVDTTESEHEEKVREFALEQDFAKHPRRRSRASNEALASGATNASAADIAHINSTALEADTGIATAVNNTILQSTTPTTTEQLGATANKTARVKEAALTEISEVPRLAATSYLRKMAAGWRILKGLPLQEVRRGRRIAIINAAGGIGPGVSGTSLMGVTLGADTLIAQIQQARDDPTIKAVVLRVDSPGGAALASDLIWRELRLLSREKPVVASQVDVAASGGYYLSMACDEIVAEPLTLTGSIGVVSTKFNTQKLNEKIGLNTETISIGRYAEIMSTTRGFTDEEAQYFEDAAQSFYKTFVAKAAASRSMSYEDMQQVAQGRVWTGQQGLRNGLVDHLGGLWKALEVAEQLSQQPAHTSAGKNTTQPVAARQKQGNPRCYRVETMKAPRSSGSWRSLLSSAVQYARNARNGGASGCSGLFGTKHVASAPAHAAEQLALCDDIVLNMGLSSTHSWGTSSGSSPLWLHLTRNFMHMVL